MQVFDGLPELTERIIFSIEHEHITVQCTQERFRREAFGTGDYVLVEKGVAVVVGEPRIQTFIEMLQMVA